jgi:hypothetical protein
MCVAFWHTSRLAGFSIRYIDSPARPSAKDDCGDSPPANKNGGLIMTGVQGFFGPKKNAGLRNHLGAVFSSSVEAGFSRAPVPL